MKGYYMLEKLRAAITVLNKGEELTHAAAWKSRQNVANTILALLSALLVFLPDSIKLSGDDLALLAGAVGVLAGAANNYLTTATSAKVGLPPERGDSPDP